MKNRILILAMAVVAAIGMISCGNPNPEAPDTVVTYEETVETVVTMDNVDNYIKTIGNYTGREIQASLDEVTDELAAYYAEYTFKNQSFEGYDEAAKNGDTLIIDFEGKMDGVAFDGGTAEGQALTLGSGMFIPGFEEGLVGVNVGETVDLNLTFPDPYGANPDFSGEECVFTVTVHKIIPGLSDEAVAMLNNSAFSNKEEYVAYVKEMLEDQARNQFEQDVVNNLISLVVSESEFNEIPQAIMDDRESVVYENFGSVAAQYGYTVPDLLVEMGTSLEELKSEYAKQQIVFYKIAKDNNLTVSDAELNENINIYIDLYEDISSAEDLYNYIPEASFRESILVDKVISFLIERTSVVQAVTE